MSLQELVSSLKHLAGKHPQKTHGHGSEEGGSSEGYSQAAIDNALKFISLATTSSRGMPELSEEARRFLAETVDPKKPYKLYRGIGLVRSRVSKDNYDELSKLAVGDPLPDILSRQVNSIASYSKKKSVAKSYSEGALSVIAETTDKSKIVADLENLPKVLAAHGVKHSFDESDFEYWKSDKEVFVDEPAYATVIYKSGQL